MLLLLQTDQSKRHALPMRHGIHTRTLAQQTCMANRPENRSQSTPLVMCWRVLRSKLICITTAPKWWSLPQW